MASAMPNVAKGLFLTGNITGLSDTFKIVLMNTSFVFDPDTHSTYADVIANEVANGLGYTAGGQALSGVALTVVNSGNYAMLSWSQAEWTAAGGSILASGAIIFDDSTTLVTDGYADAVISYIDFGETKTTTDGKILRIQNINVTFS